MENPARKIVVECWTFSITAQTEDSFETSIKGHNLANFSNSDMSLSNKNRIHHYFAL